MVIHRLTAPVVVLLWVLSLIPTTVHAQYAEGLPPGILSVEVDGQPIDAVTIPVTNNPTPEISGRVELGVQVIELAVANGEVTRFSAELDDRGRFRVPVPQPLPDGQYTLYINDVLIGVFTIESGAANEQRVPGPLLDIARVVPYPADFGELIPGIGFLDGRFYTLEEEAARTAATANGDVRQTQRRLAEAGWLQRYENRLAVPNADNPDVFDIQISSFVIEYASGGGRPLSLRRPRRRRNFSRRPDRRRRIVVDATDRHHAGHRGGVPGGTSRLPGRSHARHDRLR